MQRPAEVMTSRIHSGTSRDAPSTSFANSSANSAVGDASMPKKKMKSTGGRAHQRITLTFELPMQQSTPSVTLLGPVCIALRGCNGSVNTAAPHLPDVGGRCSRGSLRHISMARHSAPWPRASEPSPTPPHGQVPSAQMKARHSQTSLHTQLSHRIIEYSAHWIRTPPAACGPCAYGPAAS
ncbi:telomerase reverse transcriptase/ribonuclease HI [Trypanosoma rangeli]|uniref:Telomerase reverse transcriptase/ribonuclease HI n=1 Tax=Trypanosoma rangeli TaxID=5698 RepID=A0A422MQW2_TRYRA|nr:telomerase reverse transcriptase/ribonuclease HI [Trypanosoma rangeli]RNE95581.1 telomerase reverse transcriptase/ribonuclease HI [Trypanosoma rangeli]|eukprot:RNE95581.1 telomerase reverse transcriptase/ribonuclease HI [Trypanosoma rangeli]